MKMALYDNKYWLLTHIRNSFISTDDTGMCELIMSGEESYRHHQKQLDLYPDPEESDDDDISYESYDLQMDVDFGMRYRSNTAAQLEKLDLLRKRTARIKQVKWEESSGARTEGEESDDDLFQRREVPKEVQVRKSLMAQVLKDHAKVPMNPFVEFAKFDGNGQISMPVKKYKIFLTMLPENQRNYPITICCMATARILDLIGLILLKCSTTYTSYKWRHLLNYNLYITEDDGEVDRDFPCLDPKESVAKFGFTSLGLVESTGDVSKSVNFDSVTSIFLRRTNDDSASASSDRRSKEQAKIDQMQKQSDTDLELLDTHNKAMAAPLYRSYRVQMLNKVRTKQEIHLGVSGDKIEIDTVHNNRLSLGKTKPINHEMDTIGGCEIAQVKSHKTIFKIIYCQTEEGAVRNFKSYDMEADHWTANDIVQKINLILELKPSDTRKEYLAMEDTRRYRKNT